MIKKHSKKFININFSFIDTVLVFACLLFAFKGYTQSISINVNDKKQFISLMGGDMERSANNFLKARSQKEVIDYAVKDIPFNAFRVSYDKQQEMTEGDKNFSTYDGNLTAMKMMKEVNPDIKFFATMKSDYHGYSQGDRNNLPTFIYDYAYVDGAYVGTKNFDTTKYAMFLADYVEYMENSGVAITYLSTAKEWQVVSAARAKLVIETLQTILAQRNIKMPLIVDAGSWSISQGIKLVNNYNNNNVTQYVHGFSSHDLWSGENKTWGEFIATAQSTGKKAYADETGHSGGGFISSEVDFNSPLKGYAKKCEYYKGGLEGELIFEIWPRGYNEVQKNGFYAKPIFFNNGSKAIRMRAYYIMKKFATEAVNKNYISSSINNMPDVSTMVFGDDNKVALWVVNDSETDYNTLSIAVNNLGLKEGMIVKSTSWEESSNIEGVKQTLVTTNNNQFIATNVKAKSITCFVITTDYKINPAYRINNESWINSSETSIRVNEGDNIDFSPQSSITGSWQWSGPNGYTASTREISLLNITTEMAGNYVATYTSSSGETTNLTMSVSLTCNTTPVTNANYQIEGNSLVTGNYISINVGESLTLSPQYENEGSWLGSGPNNYSASTREIKFDKFYFDMAGNYTVTYTSTSGCSKDIVYNINPICTTTPNINPYSRINTDAWVNTRSELDVSTGDTVSFGPNSNGAGTWYWTGPNNFYAQLTREIIIENITLEQSGAYTVTKTNNDGCKSSYTFTVYVDGALSTPENELIKPSMYPNPVKDILFINHPNNNYKKAIIYDLTGRIVLSKSINEKNDKTEINVNQFKKGIYLLNLKGSTTNETFKFIKN